MNLNCVGYYYIKDSSSNHKKENKWIKSYLCIKAHIDRYILEITPVLEDDDIYDEDEDERSQRLPRKLKLTDYKSCEPRGFQKFNNFTIHLLMLNPKWFSKAKKLYLAFIDEDVLLFWHKNLDTIFTHKFQSSATVSSPINESHSVASIDSFMIDNDIYEGSLMPGEFYATVLENSKSKEISIKGRYILAVTDIGIELRDDYTNAPVKIWELKNMRRFGESENIFHLELGKYSADGQGPLSFKVDRGKQLIKELLQTKENCIKNKNRPKIISNQLEDQMYIHKDKPIEDANYNIISKSITFSNCQNKLYGAQDEDELGDQWNNRASKLVPPKSAPPPIPPELLIRLD